MHATVNKADIYRDAQKAGMSDREIEAAVLMKAASMLKRCQTSWMAPDRDKRLEEAIKFNQQLWSIFQVSLADPSNPLPKQLRADILNLSLFIDRRSFEVLAYPAPEKLDILININTNLAAGLRGNVLP